MAHESAQMEKYQLLLAPHEIKQIDDWRYANRKASRAQAVRELIRLGIAKSKETAPGGEFGDPAPDAVKP
ncbi:ribbon-helix-helix domain-containing protein [Cucumibacter marinus]|uniref:hypothetical protein n=1 Tax=Cucumibacter marinus TaxID=1121252 RepID=UPI000563D15B|nr:hypothetical protein [Cucumibacter marinus]